MTSHDEQRLGDALRRQAESTDPHLLSLDDVTSRARGIRRRRVSTGIAAAVAAVAAVVAPTSALVTAGDHDSAPNYATQTPDGTPTEDPTGKVDAVEKHRDVSVLGNLPTGDAPKILVRIGSTVLLPDGTRVQVGTDAVYSALVDGAVATLERDGEGNGTFVVRDPDGSVLVREPANVDGALTVTPDRTAAAYVGADGRIHTWTRTDGDLTFSEPLDSARLGPMAGSESCKEQEPEGGGCSVVVNSGGGGAKVYTSHGPGEGVPGFLSVNDADGQLFVGQTKSFDEGSCSEVRRAFGATVASTCKFSLDGFSPDGRHLEASSAYGDGAGPSTYDVLDSDGLRSILTVSAVAQGDEMSYMPQLAWEDDTHVLVSVFDGKGWRIVRVGLDGSAELADAGEMPQGDTGEVPVRLDVGA